MGFLDGMVDAVSEGASSVWDKAEEYVPEVEDVVEVVETVAEVATAPATTLADVAEDAAGGLGDVADTVGDVASDGMEAMGTYQDFMTETVAPTMLGPIGMLAGNQKTGDTMETIGNGLNPFAGDIGKRMGIAMADGMPGVGELISAAQATYHAGAMGYDIATGDRDGAVTHGTQGLVNVLGAIPGFSESMGAVDMVLAPGGGLAKTFGGALGMKDTDDAPQSLGDLAAGFAVQHTNMLFGEDDTNWFAKGDEPTGTRRGEIGAGLNMMFMPIGMGVKAADGVMGAVDEIQGEKHEEWNPLGDLVGGIFETPKDAPTVGNTGSKPNSWQRDGRRHHDDLFREPLPSHGGSPGRLPSHDGSASLFQGMYD